MYPHRIRLRGPWEYEPLEAAAGAKQPLPPAGRMSMPCRWRESGLKGFIGRVRFRRRFGRPRQIDREERLWITFNGMQGVAEVWLNGCSLGGKNEKEAFEFEITSLVTERNELIVDVDTCAGDVEMWGEVALEVRRTAFLRSLHVSAVRKGQNARVTVSGEVAGVANQPLELYVICDRSTIAYGLVEAAEAGRTFHLTSEELRPGQLGDLKESASISHHVRVELVKGASVWYSVELPCALPPEVA